MKALLKILLPAVLFACISGLTVSAPTDSATKTVTVVPRDEIVASRAAKWALLVGVNDYDSADLRDLDYAVSDVDGVYDVLVDPDAGGFDPANVIVMTDDSPGANHPTWENFRKKLDFLAGLKDSVGAPDTLFIFFSGHGFEMERETTQAGRTSTDKLPYLALANTSPDFLEQTAVPVEDIKAAARASGAKKVVLALDACRNSPFLKKKAFGGQMSSSFKDAIFTDARGMFIMLSAGPGQFSHEDPACRHGAFSCHFINGLAGKADADTDGRVTASELMDYTQLALVRWSGTNPAGGEQTPTFSTEDVSGKIVLAYSLSDIGGHRETPVAPDEPIVRPPEPGRTDTGIVALVVTDEFGDTVTDYTVELDGADAMLAPGAPLKKLAPGAHQIKIKAPGYYEVEDTIYAEAGISRTHAAPELRRLRGKLEITSIPSGADVYIDGARQSRTTPNVFGDLIDDKEYKVQVRKKGYTDSDVKTITVKGEDMLPLAFVLPALPALVVTANVADFKVTVTGSDCDGGVSGQVGEFVCQTSGAATVRVDAGPDYKPYEGRVTLSPDNRATVTAGLSRRNKLEVIVEVQGGSASDADGAEVFIGGKSRGKISGGRLTVYDLPEGSYDVAIRTGAQEKSQTSYVAQSMTAKAEFSLKKDDLRPPNKGGMVHIPAGSFTMGCSAGDSECGDNEKPAKQVTLTKGFNMDTTEVTQGEYERVMGKNPSYFKDCGADCPVEQVSWNDAKAYCEKVGKRLPTEAEWEYAARGGSSTAYYWGNSIDGSYAWYGDNSNVSYSIPSSCDWCNGRGTHPVGNKKANAFGLYDMMGNVWEWVADCYDGDWYSKMSTTDPVNKCSGYGDRVIRGGSWNRSARNTRVSLRNWFNSGIKDGNIGFRCAQDF